MLLPVIPSGRRIRADASARPHRVLFRGPGRSARAPDAVRRAAERDRSGGGGVAVRGGFQRGLPRRRPGRDRECRTADHRVGLQCGDAYGRRSMAEGGSLTGSRLWELVGDLTRSQPMAGGRPWMWATAVAWLGP